MENVKVPGAQCDNVGEGQGYSPISIRYETQQMVMGDGAPRAVPVMVTHWRLSPDELEALKSGDCVLALELLGTQWPPSRLFVDLKAEPAGRG